MRKKHVVSKGQPDADALLDVIGEWFCGGMIHSERSSCYVQRMSPVSLLGMSLRRRHGNMEYRGPACAG